MPEVFPTHVGMIHLQSKVLRIPLGKPLELKSTNHMFVFLFPWRYHLNPRVKNKSIRPPRMLWFVTFFLWWTLPRQGVNTASDTDDKETESIGEWSHHLKLGVNNGLAKGVSQHSTCSTIFVSNILFRKKITGVSTKGGEFAEAKKTLAMLYTLGLQMSWQFDLWPDACVCVCAAEPFYLGPQDVNYDDVAAVTSKTLFWHAVDMHRIECAVLNLSTNATLWSCKQFIRSFHEVRFTQRSSLCNATRR